jgi:hypothetical protein
MSQYLEQPKLFDQVMRLEEKERREPLVVIEQFFSDYRLHECRHILWTMVEACLTTDHWILVSRRSERTSYYDIMIWSAYSRLVTYSYRSGPVPGRVRRVKVMINKPYTSKDTPRLRIRRKIAIFICHGFSNHPL